MSRPKAAKAAPKSTTGDVTVQEPSGFPRRYASVTPNQFPRARFGNIPRNREYDDDPEVNPLPPRKIVTENFPLAKVAG